MIKRGHFFQLLEMCYLSDLDKIFIFEDTFSIINSVKFVISIDTAINYIAGYFGKKKLLLLETS